MSELRKKGNLGKDAYKVVLIHPEIHQRVKDYAEKNDAYMIDLAETAISEWLDAHETEVITVVVTS
jgi:hypothetical protein